MNNNRMSMVPFFPFSVFFLPFRATSPINGKFKGWPLYTCTVFPFY
jgi:hypothetical protein